MHMRSTCDAIVMNRQGTGVCLQTSTTGTIVIPNKNSSKIIGFIKDTLKLPWPESDPMMWEKFFDQTSGSGVYDFFSPKCATEDAVCKAANATASLLPDSTDLYFTTP